MKKILIAFTFLFAITECTKAQEKTLKITDVQDSTYTFTAVGNPYTIGKNIYLVDAQSDLRKGTVLSYVGKGNKGNYYATLWSTLEDEKTVAILEETEINLENVKKLAIQYMNIFQVKYLTKAVWMVNIKMKNPDYLYCFKHTFYNSNNDKKLFYMWNDEMKAYFKDEADARAFADLFRK